ncbi:hypothetical protein [Labrys miyagiensis]|nr:hypothetical protein [Labrys miyagiensis]
MDTPNVVIFNFLSKLPVTIARDIQFQVLLHAFDMQPALHLDFVAILDSKLVKSTGLEMFSSTLKVVGVTEYVLGRTVTDGPRNEVNLKILAARLPDDPIAQKIALGQGLRARHFEAAFHSWRGLRDAALSQMQLSDFETRCLLERLS